jgi:membrane protein required for colicin V production
MIIDFLFVAIAAYGFVLGFKAGVVKILLTGFSVFIGFVLAIRFTPNMNEILQDMFLVKSPFLPFISLILAFLMAMIGIRILAQLLEGILKSMDLDKFNNVAGGLLVSIVLLFLYSGMLWFLQKAQVISTKIEVIDKEWGKKHESNYRLIDPEETLILKDTPDFLYVKETLPMEDEQTDRKLKKTEREKSSFQNSYSIKFVNIFLKQFDVFMHSMRDMTTNLWNDMINMMKEQGEAVDN